MDGERCKEKVFKKWHHYQCQNKAWKDGYCKQHHPETVKAKSEARDKAWEEKWANMKTEQVKNQYRTVIELTEKHGFQDVAEYFKKKLEEMQLNHAPKQGREGVWLPF